MNHYHDNLALDALPVELRKVGRLLLDADIELQCAQAVLKIILPVTSRSPESVADIHDTLATALARLGDTYGALVETGQNLLRE